jgi:pantetheine-phosphate adenylyltransferase
MTTKIALFPGSFDPPTLGHLDLIQRAHPLFDHLYIAIAKDTIKKPLFSVQERLDLLKQISKELSCVTVTSFSGLATQFARSIEASCLIRGLRPFSHLEEEFRMALANRKLASIETLFILAGESCAHISSSLVREVGMCGGDLSLFVPSVIQKQVQKRLLERSGS